VAGNLTTLTPNNGRAFGSQLTAKDSFPSFAAIPARLYSLNPMTRVVEGVPINSSPDLHGTRSHTRSLGRRGIALDDSGLYYFQGMERTFADVV
jgi:hypothetical protein